jgi:hypothetical protein
VIVERYGGFRCELMLEEKFLPPFDQPLAVAYLDKAQLGITGR